MPNYNASAKNPLESLENTGAYDFSYLTYPREFDDISSFGHYMNFYINVNKATRYMNGSSYNVLNTPTKTTDFSTTYTPAYGAKLADKGYKETQSATLGGNAGLPGFGPLSGWEDILTAIQSGDTGSLATMSQTRITQAISLYIPDSMSFVSGYDWQDASLTEAGGKLLKGGQIGGGAYSEGKKALEGKATEALKHLGAGAVGEILAGAGGAGNSIGDIGLAMAGVAVNPQIFVLFRSVDLRSFQFDFIFTPKSPEEAKNVRNIIKAFRFHAAPEIDKRIGRYFIAPSTFNIEYMYKGNRNENIFQMSTCALTRLAVDYAPRGWSTYIDGMPIQTTLSMQFKEMEILTKEKVNQGY